MKIYKLKLYFIVKINGYTRTVDVDSSEKYDDVQAV